MVEIAAGSGPGRIVHRTFLGEKTDYVVELGGSRLQVAATDHYRRPAMDAGQAVSVRFHPEGIHVL
ncbi:MAG: TOBE domain-containing protein [Acidimicrobiia bacterium]